MENLEIKRGDENGDDIKKKKIKDKEEIMKKGKNEDGKGIRIT